MALDPAEFIRTQTQIVSPSIIPELRLHLATEVTPLWKLTEEALAQHSELPPPYWAFAWPGGQGLARYVLDTSGLVEGKRIIDLASGSGIVALAAMKAGAKSALAVDIDKLALEAIKLNAMLNGVDVKVSEGLNLKKPPSQTDLILAGDICYQQSMSASLTRWLRLCVEAGIPVYIADPGRAYVPYEGMVNLASYDVPTSRDLEDREMRTATVWRMEKLVASEQD
jgi:predicted nicotinamide N-methyase